MQIQVAQNHVTQNVSATSRRWSFIAIIMSIMHFVAQCYQLSAAMIKKVKQITVMLVNVNQVSVTIIAIINQRRRQDQRRNHSRQMRRSGLQYLCTFILFSALFATCVFIMFRFVSLNPSSSQSSCLTAVSNSAESPRSQVLHLLSTSVVTFISRMAAAPQPSAAVNAVTESAALVDKSMQSMTVAHIKNEELNNDAQAPVVRHSLSQAQSTQKDQDLQRVMEQVRVNTEPSRDERLLKCLIKSQMADHPQQWDDHSGDIRYFIGSFKYFQGDFETLFTISQGYDHYFIVLSESEYHSWQTYGWIRSPRVSDELAGPQDQVYHAFTCSTGLVMPSITCATSQWLIASCSIATVNQVMGDTTSTQEHSGARFNTSLKCQRKQGQESCVLSLIRSQCHSRMKSSSRRSSFTSSSDSIRSGQRRLRCSTSVRQLHPS